MTRQRLSFIGAFLLAALVSVTPGAQTQDPPMRTSAVPQTAEWQALRSLVGEWTGVMEMEGKKMPAEVEVRMTGDGSAVMHVMDKGGPYEMVTMFHPDGKRLLATHYCAAHNQPRMALVTPSGPNRLAFEFVDGTNIAPGDLHMKRLVITIKDVDHHDEAWTSAAGGKETPATVFSFSRKK